MFAKSKNKGADEASTYADAPVALPSEEADSADPRGGGVGGGFVLERNKPSVISEGFALVGDLNATGVLHVEGSIKGTVTTDVVNIGPRGAIDGQVRCKSLHIKGNFVGTARCDDLFIAGKAMVSGRIAYLTLSVQRGAVIEGDLTRIT